MLESELRIDVLDSFTVLSAAIDDLADKIRADEFLVAWVQQQHGSARDNAIAAFRQLHYLDDQDPREIFIMAGFVGASATTLEQAVRVNQCKDTFKQAILALKNAKIPTTDPWLLNEFETLLNTRTPNTANTLKRLGLVRLHLKQCYRKIPILAAAPQKISWTWAHTKSIKKINVAKAQEMLQKRGKDSGIQIQLQKLGALSPKEPLAIVQELAPHLRANIVFPDHCMKQRLMIKGPVPILFPADLDTPYPDFKPPTEKRLKSESRSQRSDVRLEAMPFLPAIRVHRYTPA